MPEINNIPDHINEVSKYELNWVKFKKFQFLNSIIHKHHLAIKPLFSYLATKDLKHSDSIQDRVSSFYCQFLMLTR